MTSTTEPLGLELSDDLTEEKWEELGEGFGRKRNLTAWEIGDWLVYAADRWDGGEQTDNRYARAEELTGFKNGTLRNRAYVARRFVVSRRRDTLSFEHHHAVTAMQDDAPQDRWLDKAKKKGWSAKSLWREKSEANPKKPKLTEAPSPGEPEDCTVPITFRNGDADLPERIQRIAEAEEVSMDAWITRVLREAVKKVEAVKSSKQWKKAA